MLIIGVDPGKSFGASALYRGEMMNYIQSDQYTVLAWLHQLLTNQAALNRANDNAFPVHIACEQFIVTPAAGRKAGASDTGPLVGQVVQLAQEFHVPITLQLPADAKRAFPVKILKQLGLYRTGKDVDAVDANDVNSATRHALLWMMRNQAQDFTHLMRDVNLS